MVYIISYYSLSLNVYYNSLTTCFHLPQRTLPMFCDKNSLGQAWFSPQNNDLVPSHFTKWSDEGRLVELWLDRGFQPFTRG